MYDITTNRLQQTVMQSALEHLNEYRNTLKMSTGSVDLDWLIDNVQEGIFYLFYSTNHAILDAMVYRLLINCVLPKVKHGFESMTICFNNIGYHDNRNTRTTFLNPEKIGITAKCTGIDPKIVFKNLYIHTASNQKQQISVAEQVAALIESNENIKLLFVNQLTKFVRESRGKNR